MFGSGLEKSVETHSLPTLKSASIRHRNCSRVGQVWFLLKGPGALFSSTKLNATFGTTSAVFEQETTGSAVHRLAYDRFFRSDICLQARSTEAAQGISAASARQVRRRDKKFACRDELAAKRLKATGAFQRLDATRRDLTQLDPSFAALRDF
jgi:hypothetical protein